MTLILVSLFLPYTVKFDCEESFLVNQHVDDNNGKGTPQLGIAEVSAKASRNAVTEDQESTSILESLAKGREDDSKKSTAKQSASTRSLFAYCKGDVDPGTNDSLTAAPGSSSPPSSSCQIFKSPTFDRRDRPRIVSSRSFKEHGNSSDSSYSPLSGIPSSPFSITHSPSSVTEEANSREDSDDAYSFTSFESTGDPGNNKINSNDLRNETQYRTPLLHRKRAVKRSNTIDVNPSPQEEAIVDEDVLNHDELIAQSEGDSEISGRFPEHSASDSTTAASGTTNPLSSNSGWRRLNRTRSLSFAGRRQASVYAKGIFGHGPLQYGRYSVIPFRGGNGGARNAFFRAESDGTIGKDTKWIGTIAKPVDGMDKDLLKEIASKMELGHNCIPVFVDNRTFEGHYIQYCKQILWPTMHYQTPEDHGSNQAKYGLYHEFHHSWERYKALNQMFADAVVQAYKNGDIVWVNDYHLMLVPEMVRKKLPEAQIGFFLHVSFPSSEVFRCLPQRKELLSGILGANCVGFQISEYSRHFLQTCNRILAVDAVDEGINTLRFISKDNLRGSLDPKFTENKFVSVVDCAIGIDKLALDSWLTYPGVQKWREILRKRWPNIKLIVARDKLDNIRGVKQKLLGYEEFLKSHPEWIDKCALIEIGIDDLYDSGDFEGEIFAIVERINSLRGDLAAEAQPVMFLQQLIDFDQYVALLCEADVFAVTSLREGMNLTCHEFVYCNKKNSPLILSEFTGSAAVLNSGSLLVNPWDRKEVAGAFHKALIMPEHEKVMNWNRLHSYVVSNSCSEWVERFIQDLEYSFEEELRHRYECGKRLNVDLFRSKYRQVGAGTRIFFLNLDGVSDSMYAPRSGLSPTSQRSRTSTPAVEKCSFLDPALGISGSSGVKAFGLDRLGSTYVPIQRRISVISELVSDPQNRVYVLSRESRRSMERIYIRVPGVGLIAENGAFLRPTGPESKWTSFVDTNKSKKWQQQVLPVLRLTADRDPGCRIEVAESAIYFDARPMFSDDADRARTLIGEVVNHINDMFGSESVHAKLENNGVVSVSSRELTGANAIEQAFGVEMAKNPVSYLLVAPEGQDSLPDLYSSLYDWAHELQRDGKVQDVCTISVGGFRTAATWSLDGINALLSLLLAAATGR